MIVQFKKSGTELNRALKLLNFFIEKDRVKCPGDVKKFVFLCGANKNNGEPSARRTELIKFSEKQLSNCHFFLAELIFKELSEDDDAQLDNLLDIESELSALADHILIILESYSSFTELGAFSYSKELRGKLIVINNSKYINQKSFINMGPIKAITEVNDKGHFLHYKMNESSDAIDRADGIGAVFAPLHDLLARSDRKQARTLKKDDLNPATNFNKDSIRFIHDIIFTCGSITQSELIEILVEIFGNTFSFKKHAQKHLGVLKAINIINTSNGFYYSLQRKYYFKYGFDIESISSTFKLFFLKNAPERIYLK
ncbi:retron St85 family effector protein [Candidatus Pantoea floridensis]|uniref:Uncharacterized protein n=1 Tax=Candidatus Pantoea floridensis TaxID=1938870 RepID=A0A286BYN8_9GAMM|nr:retron St85 family effector protein [Pantoea floridensis]PIF21762.1 hypothetical protein BX596_1162 [Enterobacteriaceae bacterium JKS000233]SOD39272.1 hypothetical protein SAMN06273570_3714 [Pantoea floridensis]